MHGQNHIKLLYIRFSTHPHTNIGTEEWDKVLRSTVHSQSHRTIHSIGPNRQLEQTQPSSKKGIGDLWHLTHSQLQKIYVFLNLLKSTFYVMHQQVQYPTTIRSAHIVFVCFVFISEQTATCATYSINSLVFITEMKSVYSAVRTGPLNKAVRSSFLKVFSVFVLFPQL